MDPTRVFGVIRLNRIEYFGKRVTTLVITILDFSLPLRRQWDIQDITITILGL